MNNGGKIAGIALVVILGIARIACRTNSCNSSSSDDYSGLGSMPSAADQVEMCNTTEIMYLAQLDKIGLPEGDMKAMRDDQMPRLRAACPAAARRASACLAAGGGDERCAEELVTEVLTSAVLDDDIPRLGHEYWHSELAGTIENLVGVPGHRAVVQVSIDGDHVIVGLDDQGREAWRFDEPVLAGGLLVAAATADEVEVITEKEIVGLDPVTGKTRWRSRLKPAAIWVTEAGGISYVGTDEYLYRIDLPTARRGKPAGKRLIKVHLGDDALGDPMGPHRLAISSDKQVAVYDLDPPRLVGKRDMGAAISDVEADGDRVVVTTEGKLTVLAVDQSGKLVEQGSITPDVGEEYLEVSIKDDLVVSRRAYGLWRWKVGAAAADRVAFPARSTGDFAIDGNLWSFCVAGPEGIGVCRVSVADGKVTAVAKLEDDFGENGDTGAVRVSEDMVLASVAKHLVALPRGK